VSVSEQNRAGLCLYSTNGEVSAVAGTTESPGDKRRVTHPKCGKSWIQRGNRTGHCAKCHETFEGLTAFDAHQKLNDDGSVRCLPPASVKVGGQLLRLVGDSWRGPGMPESVRARYNDAAS